LNGQVTFNIDMDYTAQLMYMDNNIAVDKEQVEVINSEMQALLLDEIVQAIQHSLAIGCDYLELWDVFRIHYPVLFRQLDWTSAYQNAVFNISVSSELDPGGLMDMEAQGERVS
jgi:hypothetical protein